MPEQLSSDSLKSVASLKLLNLSEYPILDEMWRLGFLADESEFTADEIAVIRQQVELEVALEKAYKNNLETPYSKELSIEDLIDSNRIQNITSVIQPSELSSRYRQWLIKQGQDIVHLGQNVSSGLEDKETAHDRLKNNNLDVIETVIELVRKIGISISELRFLSYSKKISTVRHYRHFDIEKKSGGFRRISTPMPRLKRVQYWILDNILNKVELHPAAHGFIKGRSICTNAEPHVGSQIVANLDLENFFPTITFARVKGLFRSLGYSHQLSTIFALLCTEYDFDQVALMDKKYFVGKGERKLPQGAPTSPAISNIICRQLDRRLEGVATQMEYVYTRYADDLTFSTRENPARNVQKLLWRCRKIVEDEGFKLHPAKTKIMRKHRQQKVTGIVVNEKLSLDRKLRKRFRALIYQLKNGDQAKVHWMNKPNDTLPFALIGFAHFFKMLESEKGEAALKALQQTDYITAAFSAKEKCKVGELTKGQFRRKAALGQVPRDSWWTPASKFEENTQEAAQGQSIASGVELEVPHGAGTALVVQKNKEFESYKASKNKTKGKVSMLVTGFLFFLLLVAVVILVSR